MKNKLLAFTTILLINTIQAAAVINVVPFSTKLFSNNLLLTSFEAKRLDNYTQLTWKTNKENNVAYFLVQRSDDGKRFTNIYEQPAFHNEVVEQYTIQDNKAIQNVAYYRLMSVNKNGEESLSQVVKISSTRAK